MTRPIVDPDHATLPRVAYLAHPIDRADSPYTTHLIDDVSSKLINLGWIVYNPGDAWLVHPHAIPGPEIEYINRQALHISGLVVALMPGDPTVGVPMEIEAATQRGIKVMVYGPRPGWALAGSAASVYTRSEDLIAALPKWSTMTLTALNRPEYLRFQVGPTGTLPTRTHKGDVGFDLYTSQDQAVPPLGFADLHCDVKVALPLDTWASIAGRSSTWRKWGLFAIPGVIDTGYRGELLSAVSNPSDRPVFVPAGTRLTQLILHKNLAPGYSPIPVTACAFDDIPGDSRGSDGFGSSGL